MTTNVLVDGDKVMYQATIGVATVTALPGAIKANSNVTIGGSAVCVEGDENTAKADALNYIQTAYTNGMGMAKVKQLLPSQKASNITIGGKAVLLQGTQLLSEFSPQAKAMQPAGPNMVPDPMPVYIGPAPIVGSNKLVSGG